MGPFGKELGEMANYTAALSLPGPMASVNTANIYDEKQGGVSVITLTSWG